MRWRLSAVGESCSPQSSAWTRASNWPRSSRRSSTRTPRCNPASPSERRVRSARTSASRPRGWTTRSAISGARMNSNGALQALERHGVLVVSGSSGVGKSSFVRAGIGAHFAARGRRVIVVTPGERPVETLREVRSRQRVAADRRPVRAGVRERRPGGDRAVLRRTRAHGVPRHDRDDDPRRSARGSRRPCRLRRTDSVESADAGPTVDRRAARRHREACATSRAHPRARSRGDPHP